jgi:hypothetical protein
MFEQYFKVKNIMKLKKPYNIKKIAIVILAIVITVSILLVTVNSHSANKKVENNVANISYINVLIFNGDGANSFSVDGLKDSMDYSNNNNLTPNIRFNYSTTYILNTEILSKYDVLVMPGGDYQIYLENNDINSGDIKKFLSSGKGFLGICAGAYAGTVNYGWGFAPHTYAKYVNFDGTQQVTVTPYGSNILNYSSVQNFEEENGPGIYRSILSDSIAKFTSNGTIYGNYSAIMDDNYGNGRVILSSPHIEKTNGKPELLIHSLLWVSKKI